MRQRTCFCGVPISATRSSRLASPLSVPVSAHAEDDAAEQAVPVSASIPARARTDLPPSFHYTSALHKKLVLTPNVYVMHIGFAAAYPFLRPCRKVSCRPRLAQWRCCIGAYPFLRSPLPANRRKSVPVSANGRLAEAPGGRLLRRNTVRTCFCGGSPGPGMWIGQGLDGVGKRREGAKNFCRVPVSA